HPGRRPRVWLRLHQPGGRGAKSVFRPALPPERCGGQRLRWRGCPICCCTPGGGLGFGYACTNLAGAVRKAFSGPRYRRRD
ncbi:hypothetical protein C3E94_27960, partial [Klebsiella pneumoniae]